MDQNITHENPLGVLPVGKLLRKFALPGIISFVVNALYNIVDQIFIGQGVGYLGNGATNVIFPITMITIALSLMIGDGSASMISLKLGEGKKEDANRTAASGILGTVIIGIVLAVIFMIALKPICNVFGATELTLPYAIDYGKIIIIGMPFMAIATSLSSIIRADGSPSYTMVGLLTGCIINAVMDPIMIFVFHWGVKGAALATILGQIVNAIINLCYLRKPKSVNINSSSFRGFMRVLPKSMKLGISSFINNIVIVIIIAIQNNVLVTYGASSQYGAEIPMTAVGVTMKIFNILVSVCLGLCTGAQPIWGYNYGATKYDRVKKTYKKVLIIGTVVCCVAFALFQLIPSQIISIFGNESDLYNQFSIKCLRIFLFLCLTYGLHFCNSIFFQAVGKPLQSSLISLSKQIIFQVPLTLILPVFMGVEGVLWAGLFADLLTFVMNVLMIKLSWKKIFRKRENTA